jgi:hypothetical protein
MSDTDLPRGRRRRFLDEPPAEAPPAPRVVEAPPVTIHARRDPLDEAKASPMRQAPDRLAALEERIRQQDAEIQRLQIENRKLRDMMRDPRMRVGGPE